MGIGEMGQKEEKGEDIFRIFDQMFQRGGLDEFLKSHGEKSLDQICSMLDDVMDMTRAEHKALTLVWRKGAALRTVREIYWVMVLANKYLPKNPTARAA